MFEIKNGIIKITKGDSAALDVALKNTDGSSYTMQTGDKLKITVRKRISSSVLMEVESTTTTLDLTPTKTKNLEAGECYFDIQLTTSAGDVFTVVGVKDKPNMIVYPEITV